MLLPSAVFLLAQAVPAISVSNAATPTTIVNAMAVKRDWTLEDSDFCKERTAADAMDVYPRSPLAKLKYIKTFSFRSSSSPGSERNYLDVYKDVLGIQSSFPWQDGKWLARQYVATLTPRYTYLLEMQERPKAPNEYSPKTSVCVTVFGIR